MWFSFSKIPTSFITTCLWYVTDYHGGRLEEWSYCPLTGQATDHVQSDYTLCVPKQSEDAPWCGGLCQQSRFVIHNFLVVFGFDDI